jgi:hypothetical protein
MILDLIDIVKPELSDLKIIIKLQNEFKHFYP